MSDDKPIAVSRRTVLAVGSVVPVAGGLLTDVCAPQADDLVARCAQWLALDLEIDRLSLRWSALETTAVREFNWFALSRAQRRAVPLAAEMDQIDARLNELFKVRRRGLKALAKLPARDVHGVASKLVVAARISQYEDGGAHRFIADAVRTLAVLRCPNCGAPYAPATPGQR
jgi:hypothetical protein